MRKRLLAIGVAGALALSAPGAALADSPHAGNSGHFKGGSQPCKADSNNPHCPPFGN